MWTSKAGRQFGSVANSYLCNFNNS